MDNTLWLRKLHDPNPIITGSGSGAFGLSESYPGNGRKEAVRDYHACAILTPRIYTA